MTGAPRETAPLDLKDEAARWFSRRRSGTMSAAEAQAFDAWLERDPEHRDAFAAIERAWSGAGAVRGDPRVLAQRAALMKARSRRPGAWAPITWTLAACLALAAVVGGGVGVRWLSGPRPLATQDFHTDVGQRSTVTLPDGSVVTLNTDTEVRTRGDRERRLVYLVKGQAYFKVAKDRSHPFVVAAAGRTVTALGTAFDVRIDRGELKVTLVEGKVRVEAPVSLPAGAPSSAVAKSPVGPPGVQATEMVAGSQLVAPDDQDWRLSRADVVRETSWTHGQIIFDDKPLSEVVDELNRYTDQKMVLADPDLGATPISGTFKPGDVHGFIKALEAYKLARQGDETREVVRVVDF